MSPIQFIRENIWSHLPKEVGTRQRLWGAALWGAALIGYGFFLAWQRERAGEAAGFAPQVFYLIGVVIGVLLLIPPPVGSGVYLGVLRVASIFGFFLSLALLTLAFYLVVTPMGLLMRLTGKDPLQTRRSAPPHWSPHRGSPERRRYYRLF